MALFDEWVQKGHEVVHEVMKELGIEDEHKAFRLLRAVLQTLRDRLPANEGKDFAAQLPMVLKAVWCDGWDPTRVPDKSIKHKQDFLEKVMNHPGLRRPADIENLEDADRVVTAVFRVLKRHISYGEIKDVLGELPEDIREMLESA
ncbi:MAG: hypothetical protein DSY32_01195 [Aquifex sp.]|nr:MAG: hypothetical protein DSY32_01195 [Aquifex sp.]